MPGFMLTDKGPKLVNARFGDPECQVLMLRMMSDIVPALLACADGQLKNMSLRWFDDVAITVIMATKGYPGDYGKGSRIEGLAEAEGVEGVEIFHAGTKMQDGHLVANGGRVLNVCALGASVSEARARAHAAVGKVAGRRAFAAATSAGARWSGRNREAQHENRFNAVGSDSSGAPGRTSAAGPTRRPRSPRRRRPGRGGRSAMKKNLTPLSTAPPFSSAAP